MEITWEQGRIWHTDCDEPHRSGIMQPIHREEERTLMKCLHCGKHGYYPHGRSGPVCTDDVPNAQLEPRAEAAKPL